MPTVRSELSLDGPWRCITDGAHRGESLGYHRGDVDDSDWREVQLPSLPQATAGLGHYVGPTWYRRILQVPGGWRGSRIFFHCGAANYHLRLYVNGSLAGESRSGHLPIDINVDNLIKPGAWNLLALQVDALPVANENPGTQIGWRHVPGVLRPLRLEARNPLHIASISTWAEPTKSGGRLRVGLDIEGATEQPDITIRSIDGTWSHPLTNDWMEVPNVKPWTLEDPRLYEFEVQLSVKAMLVDSLPLRIGFRTIAARGGQLLLNGSPVYLCGFNRHEDSPRCAMLADPAMARDDLRMMKAAGANFVRLCHYPHDPRTLDLCDEMGMLVMCEIPLYWLTSRNGREREAQEKLSLAREQLRRMIQRDRHHPSVIFWSVSNETDESCADVQEANDRLLTLAHEMDDSRLAVHVSNAWPTHAQFDLDDVICINGYPNVWPWTKAPANLAESAQQWAEGIQRLQRMYPGKPVLITEFGYPAIEGEAMGDWSQERQVQAITAEAEAFIVPGVCGMTIWCWADHLWPPGVFMDGLEISPFGVVTRSREAKLSLRRVTELFHRVRGLRGAKLAEMPEGSPDVVMVRQDMESIPEFSLPKGFTIRGMYPGEAPLWTDIWRDADRSMVIDDELFKKEFGDDWDVINERCLLVLTPSGQAVGTISAWMDADFGGGDAGRIHWVAIRREWQGHGLSRAMMSRAMQILAKHHQRAYLVTQAFRLPAIALYLKFGFRPHVEGAHAEALWKYVASQMPHAALEPVRRLTRNDRPVK